MTPSLKARTGGEILVDQLKLHGVRHAFCVPGESYSRCSTRSTARATASS